VVDEVRAGQRRGEAGQRLLVAGLDVGDPRLPLVPAAAWLLDESVKKWTTYYLTKGAETKIVIPTGNRPG
jgi:hypothetical protein